MALEFTTISSSKIEKSERLEPKYFIFQTILENLKKKYSFKTIEDLSENVIRGQSPKPETYKDKFDGEFMFVRTADVKKYQINLQSVTYLKRNTFETQKRNRLKGGDILISVVGNYLGSCSVIPKHFKIAAFNDNSARIRLNNNISPYFVSYFLNSNFGQKLISSLFTRTGQKILSAGNVKKLEIPIISNNKIEISAKQIEEIEEKAFSLINKSQNILYQKLDINFSKIQKEKFYSANVSEFAKTDLWTPAYSYPLYINTIKTIQKRWETVPLGEIASLKKGDEVGSDNYKGYLIKEHSDVPFIRTSDFVNYELDQFPDFYISEEIYKELQQDLKPKDILYTKDGKIGMSAMVTECDKLVVSSGMVAIRLKENAKNHNITPEYLFTILSLKETGLFPAIRRKVTASTIPHLIEERIKEFEIPILDKKSIYDITLLVKKAFELKEKKKIMIKLLREEINNYLF